MAFTARSNGIARTQTALADINITPLVDVVLVLLIIFMITAPVLQSGIDVAVPHTRSVNQLTEERTVVTIDRNQNVFLQAGSAADTPINLDDLTTHLRSDAGADPAKKTIYVRADERVPFGAFASVMDAVKRAGITNISIVTQPIEQSLRQTYVPDWSTQMTQRNQPPIELVSRPSFDRTSPNPHPPHSRRSLRPGLRRFARHPRAACRTRAHLRPALPSRTELGPGQRRRSHLRHHGQLTSAAA